MPDTNKALAKLFDQCWRTFLDGSEIDPFDLQEMMEHTGLCEWRNATEADVEASTVDLDVGDPILCLNHAGKLVIAAAEFDPEPSDQPASPEAG